MSTISPFMASELCNIAYEVKHNLERVKLPAVVDNHFGFFESSGRYKWWFFLSS